MSDAQRRKRRPSPDHHSRRPPGPLRQADRRGGGERDRPHQPRTTARCIEASPFVALATVGAGGHGLHAARRSGGLRRVADDKTLLLPDRRGNNRIDSLRNIVRDPRVALLFLIPGSARRCASTAAPRISVDPALLERFTVDGKSPRWVIVVTVERVYFQCSKAIVRSKLWDPSDKSRAARCPPPAPWSQALTKGAINGPELRRAVSGTDSQTLY